MTTETQSLSGRILLAAFEGWSDAGNAASQAADWLRTRLDLELVHSIGGEGYVDYQVHRPKVSITEDGTRKIDWPDTQLYGPVARPALVVADDATPLLDTDRVRHISGTPVTNLFVLSGAEPARNWQSFADEMLELVHIWDIDAVIMLGSLFSDAPHSRPISTSMTSDSQLMRTQLGAKRSDYEGPVGISSIVTNLLHESGIQTVTLWAQVPHYVHSAPSPKATLALLDQLEEILDVVVPRGDLVEQSNVWEKNINQIALADEDMSQYIQRLERARDAIEAPEATGDAIAYEFEKFLRHDEELGQTEEAATGTAPGSSPHVVNDSETEPTPHLSTEPAGPEQVGSLDAAAQGDESTPPDENSTESSGTGDTGRA